ncbi:unnamed protein product [Durusdinium trenchii]|uniref:VHS domain-containing protein n=2 Tax=Durusdinium trenchii TaxID=1381693 RepID=A0ABP0NM00_9DINO
MTAKELDTLLSLALRSSTIEWAVNVQICDMVKENQYLAPLTMDRINERLRSESARSVQLALSLLEMLVKNCGLVVCRAIDAGVAETLVGIVKKKESWRYGFGRNLHKSGLSDWLPQGVAIGEEKRELWRQASHKVLEIMQLCVDAFLMHEGSLRPIFGAYKQLRQEGYDFPRSSTGVAADLCLVNGAEDSPAYLAGAVDRPSAPRSAPPPKAPAPAPRSADAEEERGLWKWPGKTPKSVWSNWCRHWKRAGTLIPWSWRSSSPWWRTSRRCSGPWEWRPMRPSHGTAQQRCRTPACTTWHMSAAQMDRSCSSQAGGPRRRRPWSPST